MEPIQAGIPELVKSLSAQGSHAAATAIMTTDTLPKEAAAEVEIGGKTVKVYKTKLGLYVRAIGENPGAADASGINVTLHKYINILLGGFLCGLGGAYLSTAFLTTWQDNVTAGAGWIAVALIIFSTWNPLKAIFAAYLFGMLRGLNYKMQGWEIQIPSQFLTMLPYIATIIVLIFIAMRKKKENQPPKALGEAYFREER